MKNAAIFLAVAMVGLSVGDGVHAQQSSSEQMRGTKSQHAAGAHPGASLGALVGAGAKSSRRTSRRTSRR